MRCAWPATFGGRAACGGKTIAESKLYILSLRGYNEEIHALFIGWFLVVLLPLE